MLRERVSEWEMMDAGDKAERRVMRQDSGKRKECVGK